MKIILYMATSIDGYVATKDGDSDWVSEEDAKNFDDTIVKAGCLIVGRTTFDQFYNELYPVSDVLNIVMTKNENWESIHENVVSAQNVEEALALAKKHDKELAILIGGGKTNGLFIEAGLIDEMIITIHPLVIGEGIALFEGYSQMMKLTYKECSEIGDGVVQLVYRVVR